MEEHAILSEKLEDQLKAIEWAKAEQKRILEKKENVKDIAQSLVGAVSCTNMPLSELREERLRKYDSTD